MASPVYDWISHHAKRSPDSVAMVDLHSNRRFTYSEMNQRISGLSGYLTSQLGVNTGDRVAVLSASSTDVFEIQFACFRIGAIFVPLNWRLAVPELVQIAADADPKVLISDDENWETSKAVHENGSVSQLVDMKGDGGDSSYERGIAESDPKYDMISQTHDDVCTILYTSGTTGLPKGAMITHGMVFWNNVNLGIPAGISDDAVFLTVLPLFHTAGLNCNANPTFHAGGQVIIMRTFDPAQALDLIGDPDVGITQFFGVPAIYMFMAQQASFADTDLSRLRTSGVGGAPISTALIEAWTTRGVKLQQGYGMTETSPSVMFLKASDCERKIGSAGKPVLHNEVRIVGENDQDLGPGEVGELWVKGPNITPGYWNKPEETAKVLTDGWLHTGDAARVDEDGYYFIVDRWKDMYISGGENVYPAEVEEVLYKMPGVAEAAIIGVEDDKWGEVGCAVVVCAPETSLTEEDVISYCRGKIANYKLPKTAVFMDLLPRNATGKVLKHELRKIYG